MKILITGINGFIGKYLYHQLKKYDMEIYGLDVASVSQHALDGYFSVDITKEFVLNMDFDVIIHLAALNRTTIDADLSFKLFEEINVTGTKNLIKSCQFKKFIYISTASIYSRTNKIINECSSLQPIGNYSITKCQAEILCQKLIPEDQLLILRPVNIVGTGQKMIAAIPIFFEKAMNNQNIELLVSPDRTIQLLDISDFVQYLIYFLKSDASGIFNLAHSDYIKIRELVYQIKKICNSNSLIVLQKDCEESQSVVCSEKANNFLNWKATKNIITILEDYYKYMTKDRRKNESTDNCISY